MSKLALVGLLVMGACHAERTQPPSSPPAGRGVEDPAAERPAAQPVAAHLAIPCSTLARPMGSGADANSSAADDDSADENSSSAKRWVYASFFNRVKGRVSEHWVPSVVWRRVDPTGARYGTSDRVTEVRVNLARSGALAGICVTSPSGSRELDDEAVRAFQAAAPFTAPPEGLVGKDDMITFRFTLTFQVTPRNGTSRASPAE
jgi:TonB family protein